MAVMLPIKDNSLSVVKKICVQVFLKLENNIVLVLLYATFLVSIYVFLDVYHPGFIFRLGFAIGLVTRRRLRNQL